MELFKFNINELSKNDFERYQSYMSEKRRERLDKLKFDDDKIRSLCGYMLAVKAISDLTCTQEKDVIIEYDENGKPYAENADINFSISHSGELAVCAISENPIGVDIEKLKYMNMQSVRKFASEEEILYIFGHIPQKSDFESNDKDVIERFFKVWTAKEAYGKMLGTGIMYDMKHTKVKNVNTFIDDGYVISVCEG